MKTKLSFFNTWRKKSRELTRQQEWMSAYESLDTYLEMFGGKKIKQSDFDQLEPSKQFDLIKNILLIQPKLRYFFGSLHSSKFGWINSNIAIILPRFTDNQRYILAQIELDRNGISMLDRYQLPQALHQALIQKQKEMVQRLLPSISDEFVRHCIQKNELGALKFKMYQRFSKYVTSLMRLELIPLYNKLQNLCAETVDDFILALHDAKTKQENKLYMHGFESEALVEARPDHWGKDKNIASDTLIDFSHGGGFFNIIEFLTGKIAGYRLENPGKGLQVTPGGHAHIRDREYSARSSLYFDYPARLSGSIKARYLDSAVNSYEAGIRPNYIHFIENLKIERFDTGEVYDLGTIRNYDIFLTSSFYSDLAVIEEIEEIDLHPKMTHKPG